MRVLGQNTIGGGHQTPLSPACLGLKRNTTIDRPFDRPVVPKLMH